MINVRKPKFAPYQPSSIPLFESLYGQNLISLGGLTAIDNMFSDVKMLGLRALDLGFGLGGVAFYLAEKHKMKIAGIEIPSWMVHHAREHTPENIVNNLEFDTYNEKGELPYKAETFDLVYSKGVLNHVVDKTSLFNQINPVLEPNGLFLIADWVPHFYNKDRAKPLVCETKESYKQVLINIGLTGIHFRNDSKLFLDYIKELLKNLKTHQKFISDKYGKTIFLAIEQEHEELSDKIKQHQKIATRIIAKKH
jgi:phosphoethanolamine N-methyltransferase